MRDVDDERSMRVLIWSQHLLGTGHLQRSARLAEALAARGHEVVLANGGPAPKTTPAAYRRVDLPPVIAGGGRFDTLATATGEPPDDAFWATRRAAFEALAEPSPAAVIIEMFPFGRRVFARELAPVLERWRVAPLRPRLIVSLRDVLVERRDPARAPEVAARVERWFDRVMVHADPRLIAIDRTFPATRRIAARLRYTGYVGPNLLPHAPAERRGVVVSAGGGAVGRALLLAAVDAARTIGAALGPWTLITGRGLPAVDRAAIEARLAALGEGIPLEVVEHVNDLPHRLCGAGLSVSQAGYNTVVETMAARCPMVLIPFARPGETEQTERARAVAALGAAQVVAEAELDGDVLARAARAAAERTFPKLALDVDGAAASARLVEAIVGGRA